MDNKLTIKELRKTIDFINDNVEVQLKISDPFKEYENRRKKIETELEILYNNLEVLNRQYFNIINSFKNSTNEHNLDDLKKDIKCFLDLVIDKFKTDGFGFVDDLKYQLISRHSDIKEVIGMNKSEDNGDIYDLEILYAQYLTNIVSIQNKSREI